MATQARLTKSTIFGEPSLETAGRIDDSNKVAGLEAAHYRCSARMRELEQQFEVKASEADPPSMLCPGCEAYREHQS